MLYEALLQHSFGPKERRYDLRPRSPNSDAMAVFKGIQAAFDGGGMGRNAITDQYLVHNLAACAWVTLEYNKGDRIPLDQGEHDHILIRVVRGLMRSIVLAVRDGRCAISEYDGKYRLGGLVLPNELIEHTKEWEW